MNDPDSNQEEVDEVHFDENEIFEKDHPCYEGDLTNRTLRTANEIYWRVSERVITTKYSLTVPQYSDPLFYSVQLAWHFQNHKDAVIDNIRISQEERFGAFEISSVQWRTVRKTAEIIYVESACDSFPWLIADMEAQRPEERNDGLLCFSVLRAFVTELMPIGIKEFFPPAKSMLKLLIAKENENTRQIQKLTREHQQKEKLFANQLKKARLRSMNCL